MFDVGSMVSRLEEALKAVGEAPAEPTRPVATPPDVDANHCCLEHTAMDRREVFDLCYSAHNLANVKAAEEARAAYLVQHPEDGEILDMGELLVLLEDALKIAGEAPQNRPSLR